MVSRLCQTEEIKRNKRFLKKVFISSIGRFSDQWSVLQYRASKLYFPFRCTLRGTLQLGSRISLSFSLGGVKVLNSPLSISWFSMAPMTLKGQIWCRKIPFSGLKCSDMHRFFSQEWPRGSWMRSLCLHRFISVTKHQNICDFCAFRWLQWHYKDKFIARCKENNEI